MLIPGISAIRSGLINFGLLYNGVDFPFMIFLIFFPASTFTLASSLSDQESYLKVLLVSTALIMTRHFNDPCRLPDNLSMIQLCVLGLFPFVTILSVLASMYAPTSARQSF